MIFERILFTCLAASVHLVEGIQPPPPIPVIKATNHKVKMEVNNAYAILRQEDPAAIRQQTPSTGSK